LDHALPLFGVRFSFLTQKIASAEMGEAKVFDDLRTLSALATARAACAKMFRIRFRAHIPWLWSLNNMHVICFIISLLAYIERKNMRAAYL
jgi:hypothetical protein